MYILKIFTFQHILFLTFSEQHINSSPCTGSQLTLHKCAINQVTQCESEPQAIESTNVVATLYSKA